MRAANLAVIALAAAAATGCAATQTAVRETTETANTAIDAARRAAAPPQLAGVHDPSGLAGDTYGTLPQPISASAGGPAPNSLWRSGARTFFDDQRARRVGDILTVDISIDDSANVTNSSSRSRSGSTDVGVTSFFGLETEAGRLFPGGFDPGSLISAEGDSSANGTGTINRQEAVELTVAAVVVDILPNGNFVIAGRQEVRVNSELRELTITGVIRPEDISAENRIEHDQIAEARISYGGRGTISTVQRPRLGQRLADALSPW
jgi:flagellar L-ring protein precursor FlgH